VSNNFENLPNSVLLEMVNSKKPNQGNLTTSEINKLSMEELNDSVNTKKGASAKARLGVSVATTPEDKLATLRQFYPDALPVEVFDPENGVINFGAGNFIFTDPETNQLTTFDEDFRIFGIPVPSARDFIDAGPLLAEVTGGITGAMVGGTTGSLTGPLGTVGGMAVGEGVGSTGAREAYMNIAEYFGETIDTRSGLEKFGDLGTTFAINTAAGPVTSKIFNGVKYVFGEPIRYMTGALTKDSKKAYENMKSLGITNPTPGQITGNPALNLAESALSNLPPSTKIMRENASQTISQIDQASKRLAQKYGGIRTYEETATELLDSAQKARARYDIKVDEMYDDIRKLVPDSITSPAKNTQMFVDKYLAESTLATGKRYMEPSLGLAEQVLKDAQDGKLTFNALKNFRSSLGKDISSFSSAGAVPDGQQAKIKELYGYISKDLDDLIKQTGDTSVESMYKQANKFVHENMRPGGDIAFIDGVLAKGQTDATGALNFILRGSKVSGEPIRRLRSQYTDDEFNVLSGFMLGRMGLPTPSVASVSELTEGLKTGAEYVSDMGFSPSTFIKNWNNLSKEAKDVLFRGTPHEKLVPELDNLVTTVQRIGKTAQEMSNPSGTARIGYTMGLLTGTGVAGSTGGFDWGVTSFLTPYATAKIFTNPAMVKWFTNGLEIATYNPQSFGQHVRRLYSVWEANPEIRDEVRQMINGMSQDSIEPIEYQKSQSGNGVPEVKNELSFRDVVPNSVANKVVPVQNANLKNEIESMLSSVNQSDIPLVPPVTSVTPEAMLSETILPNPDDREIAQRMMGARGIGSLMS
jgi:uncharacterized protein YbjQ (UPF0145 family)